VTVSSRSFFYFVSCYLMSLSFTTWHNRLDFMIYILLRYLFYSYKKLLQVWKQECCVQEFWLLYFRNIFCFFSSCFTIKLPNLLNIHCLQSLMNFNFIHKSLYCCLNITFSRPNFSEIFATISAFVIFFLIYYIVIIFWVCKYRNLKTIIQANSLNFNHINFYFATNN
jgi:hypothetical protein